MEPQLFRFIWRNSRREQLVILGAILLSQPFYFASFDIPKRIINEALQGKAFTSPDVTVPFFALSLPLPASLGGTITLFNGFQVTQLGLLWGLSGLFLALVIINGAFKFYINIAKGILGERLLRRLRFALVDLYLRFRPEDIRSVKSSEAASIIKDEVESIGAFAGDAFVLPAFLTMQAATALLFILVQSVWLGLVAFAVLLIQAVVIPRLRREQLRLSRLRQIESRHLAGEVGEIVDTTPAIQVGGAGDFARGEIARRLAILFDIRVALFRRKFSVRYLNNLLAQVTPFFFYAIGGYLALTGVLNIGQLVAAIAAYKELPPPIKDLIDWDQARADVVVRYEQIVSQFPSDLLPTEKTLTAPAPAPDAPIKVSDLMVVDKRGVTQLEPMSVTIPRPSHVALLGPPGGGRDAFARVLGRQVSTTRGSVALAEFSWSGPHRGSGWRLATYAGQDPLLSSGSILHNMLSPLRRPPDNPQVDEGPTARRLRREAELSGTPIHLPDDSWIDLRDAGVATLGELEDRVHAILRRTDLIDDVYRLGLLSRSAPTQEPDLVARIPMARAQILSDLAARDLMHLVEPFDPKNFLKNATVAENLLFGRPAGKRFDEGRLASDPYLRSILEAESLLIPLIEIGLAMAETAIEVFADLAPGDPLFARFSYIPADRMSDYQRLVEQAKARGRVTELSRDGQAQLIELGLSFTEPRHRLPLLTPQLIARILRARQSFRRHLPQEYAADIEFYQPDEYMTSGTVQDNLLFGRVTVDAPDAINRVRSIAWKSLVTVGLDRHVMRLGLSHEIGPGGRLLSAEQRASLNLARALLPRAELVVIDGALGVFSGSHADRILSEIRTELAGRTLVFSLTEEDKALEFDATLVFEGPRFIESRAAATAAPAAERAPSRVAEADGQSLEVHHAAH